MKNFKSYALIAFAALVMAGCKNQYDCTEIDRNLTKANEDFAIWTTIHENHLNNMKVATRAGGYRIEERNAKIAQKRLKAAEKEIKKWQTRQTKYCTK
jgi:hypothetical protein